MAGEPYLVVDASVVVKWQLADEEAAESAVGLLHDALDGKVALFSPTLIRYELANALRVATRLGRVEAEAAAAALDDFLKIPLNIVESDEVLRRGYMLAGQLGCSVYDGIYLALAEYLSVPLYTGDRRLLNTLGGRFPWVRWVGEYSS